MYPYILGKNYISIVIDGRLYNTTDDHPVYSGVVEAVRTGNTEKILELLDLKYVVKVKSSNTIKFEDGKFFYKDLEIHNTLTERMFKMIRDGFDINFLINFMENLMENPSSTAINELYDFLDYGKNPITEDGHFLAYKKVRNDFTDIYTGTMDNSVGKTVSMPRNMVDDNRQKTCSTGLHFCSYEYLSMFGKDHSDKVIIVKVNPRDVVSIPADYNNTKARCCQYEVVSEFKEYKVKEAFDDKPVNNEYGSTGTKEDASISSKTYFGYTLDDLNSMTMTELIDLYNFGVVEYVESYNDTTDNPITYKFPLKSFKTKSDGVDRIISIANIINEVNEETFCGGITETKLWEYSNSELLRLYNDRTGNFLKKFSSKAYAIDRIKNSCKD